MENVSKQKKETLCRGLRIGIGAAMIALGALVVEGIMGTVPTALEELRKNEVKKE